MSRSSRLNQAKFTDQVIDLYKGVHTGTLSPFSEPLIAIDSNI